MEEDTPRPEPVPLEGLEGSESEDAGRAVRPGPRRPGADPFEGLVDVGEGLDSAGTIACRLDSPFVARDTAAPPCPHRRAPARVCRRPHDSPPTPTPTPFTLRRLPRRLDGILRPRGQRSRSRPRRRPLHRVAVGRSGAPPARRRLPPPGPRRMRAHLRRPLDRRILHAAATADSVRGGGAQGAHPCRGRGGAPRAAGVADDMAAERRRGVDGWCRGRRGWRRRRRWRGRSGRRRGRRGKRGAARPMGVASLHRRSQQPSERAGHARSTGATDGRFWEAARAARRQRRRGGRCRRRWARGHGRGSGGSRGGRGPGGRGGDAVLAWRGGLGMDRRRGEGWIQAAHSVFSVTVSMVAMAVSVVAAATDQIDGDVDCRDAFGVWGGGHGGMGGCGACHRAATALPKRRRPPTLSLRGSPRPMPIPRNSILGRPRRLASFLHAS